MNVDQVHSHSAILILHFDGNHHEQLFLLLVKF